MAAHSIKSNATRLGQRLGENIAERSREIGLIDSFASGVGGSSGKYLENGVVITQAGIEETKKLLSSRRESEKMEGLKRVIAMMIKNLPVTNFFPLVVSLLSPSTTFQSRTLISLYIIHCASTSPSLALLSINSYQKDLSDPNPIIRAGAIKTLSSLGLEDIRSLVGIALEKSSRDTSWYVRRSTANALIKLWRLDSTFNNQLKLLPTLIQLLNSTSPLTIGSTLSAWEEICPTRWDLIHPHFRSWCKMLIDMEEWGQCIVLRILLKYGRTFFLDSRTKDAVVDLDLELLLKSCEVLFQHLNPAVVSAVIKLYYYLAPSNKLPKIIQPLLRQLNSSPEIQMIVLENCSIIADEMPSLLVDNISEFYVRVSEPLICKKLRLRILVALTNEKNVRILLSEFLIYVKDNDDNFSAQAINAIGICSNRVPSIADECLKTLLELTNSDNDIIISQSISVLKSLLQSSKFNSKLISRSSIIQSLFHLLHTDKIKSSSARSKIYWLIGQFSPEGILETIGPDSIRLGSMRFVTESDDVKLELLTLSTKLLILSHSINSTATNLVRKSLNLIFNYITSLARYDLNYEIRDRSRFLSGLILSAGIGIDSSSSKLRLSDEDFARGVQIEDLVPGEESKKLDSTTLTVEQVRVILFEGGSHLNFDSSNTSQYQELSSIELSLPGKSLSFTSPLPPFSTKVPPSTIRDTSTSDSNNKSTTTRPAVVLRGFGSDSIRNNSSTSSRSNSPVVLIPTNFANEDEQEERVGSLGNQLQRGGFKDLNDFYADAEEEEEEEGEEESEEEESEEEEEESGSEEEEESGEESAEEEVVSK